MNGARSTFMRKGYWLTALATAVLLAASSGTALAQTASVGFDRASTSVTEGATNTRTNPAGIIKVVRTAVPDGDDLANLTVTVNVGTAMPAGSSDVGFAIAAEGGTVAGTSTTTVDSNGAEVMVAFTGDSTEVVLSISVPDADGDWADTSFNLALDSGNADIAVTRSRAVVNIADANAQPVAMFSKSSIMLNEDSSTDVMVSVGLAMGETRDAPTDLSNIEDPLVLLVEPADALDMGGPITITGVTLTEDMDEAGRYEGVGNINTLATTAATLTIKATADMVGYKSPTITLSFESDSLEPDAGDITDGGSLVINIASDEPVPTVSFSPTDVTVDEGGSVDTVLISEGKFGSEVTSVTLSVKAGDALVGLYQGMTKLEAEADGSIVVALGSSNSARLTGKSYADPDLMDGETKFIAWEITDADGANIGDGYWFRVDVNGSSAVPEPDPDAPDPDAPDPDAPDPDAPDPDAPDPDAPDPDAPDPDAPDPDAPDPDAPEPVPALPLIAQWLLGLGLMGGGARQLFRRRRQG